MTPHPHRSFQRPLHAWLVAVMMLAVGCAPVQRTLRGYAAPPPVSVAHLERGTDGNAPAWLVGQHRFLRDDFGSLDTDLLDTYGVPWKLIAAALALHRNQGYGTPVNADAVRHTLTEFGFVFPGRIANWIGPEPPQDGRPLGLLSGVATRRFPAVELEIAGSGCAVCHAGTTWDAEGRPTRTAWLGVPNSSLDLTAYVDTVVAALATTLDDAPRLLATVRTLFPAASAGELRTLRKHVIPRAQTQVRRLVARGGGGLSFANGGPGTTNGVASMRVQFGFRVEAPSSHAYVSVPFIGDRHLRSALLSDGLYGLPGTPRFAPRTPAQADAAHLDAIGSAVAFFTVPTQGVAPRTAHRAIPAMREVARYLATVRPPPFPGALDVPLAAHGESVYRAHCAGCHGTTSPGLTDVRLIEFPNAFVPQPGLGTDSARWVSADNASLARIRAVGFGRWIDAEMTGGYVAPPLTAVWATAPYLHNGSVPTLWHLLNPESRPERFETGGHALDFDKLGIAGELDLNGVYRYRAGYTPWSRPAIYDTRLPGKSNRGHEAQSAALNPEEKRAVIEYLKVL